MLRLNEISVEEKIFEGGEKADETGGVSGSSAYNCGAVSALKV